MNGEFFLLLAMEGLQGDGGSLNVAECFGSIWRMRGGDSPWCVIINCNDCVGATNVSKVEQITEDILPSSLPVC